MHQGWFSRSCAGVQDIYWSSYCFLIFMIVWRMILHVVGAGGRTHSLLLPQHESIMLQQLPALGHPPEGSDSLKKLQLMHESEWERWGSEHEVVGMDQEWGPKITSLDHHCGGAPAHATASTASSMASPLTHFRQLLDNSCCGSSNVQEEEEPRGWGRGESAAAGGSKAEGVIISGSHMSEGQRKLALAHSQVGG